MGMAIFEFNENWNTGYFLLFVSISLVVTMLCRKAAKKREIHRGRVNFYYVVAFCVLFTFEAFRSYQVGTDTQTYIEFFEEVSKYGFLYAVNSKFEIAFSLYVYVISRLFDNYTMLFVCNALIKNVILLKFISAKWKYSDSYIFLPLFILGYQYDLSAMRSGLATAFILLSILALDNKKYRKSLLISILASLFHATAFVHVFIVVVQIVLSKKWVWKPRVLAACAVVSVVTLNILSYQLQKILLLTKYQGYVRELGNGWLGNWNIVLAAIFAVMLMIKKYRKGEKFDIDEWINLLVVSMLPVYVKLNAYRIPKYYLLCRCTTYKKIGNLVELKMANKQSLVIIKFVQVLILAFGLLYFFSRNGAGFFYEFKS